MKIDYDSDYEGCYVCGKANRDGMRLDFLYDTQRDEVYTTCMFKKYMQGFSQVVHGGFLSMLLDEVMAKACLQKNIPAVTARFEVRFKKPVFVEEEMTFLGKVTEIHGKKIQTEAFCVDREGFERVSARALFVRSEL